MALVRIVGVWELDGLLLMLVVVLPLGGLRWRDSVHQRALEYLRLLHSLLLAHSWLHLLLYSQRIILRLNRFDIRIRCQGQRCRCRLWLVILSRHRYMRRIADREVLRGYRQNLLLAPNLSTITLYNVNPTVCIHRSKSVVLRLMPPNGRRKRVEQLGFGF